MKSIFAELDNSHQNQIDWIKSEVLDQDLKKWKFWKKEDEGLEKVELKICLPYVAENFPGQGKTRVRDLQVEGFEPFVEEHDGGKKFGFLLSGEEYLVETQDELLRFLVIVKKFCMLSHIEDDLIFIKKIGKGTVGTVFLAQNIDRSQKFAVKRIKKRILANIQNISNVLNEIKIHKKLDHPNICSLLYTYEDSACIYLVFEYISEYSLINLLAKEKALREKDCKAFMKTLLKTIIYINTKGVIHRDLKLEHIMLCSQASLKFKIIDFGVSCDILSTKGLKIGSPGYMAPEILKNKDYGTKIDVFSAGVILFTLLHGYPPFTGNSVRSLLEKNKKCIFTVNKKLSNSAQDVIRIMMQPSPDLRPTAKEVLEHSWFGSANEIRRTLSNVTTPDT